MKKAIFKTAFVVGSYILLSYVNDIVKPMIIADSAVTQLQDSDVAYAQFKGLQRFFEFYWLLYILPLLVFTKEIKNLFTSKGEK